MTRKMTFDKKTKVALRRSAPTSKHDGCAV